MCSEWYVRHATVVLFIMMCDLVRIHLTIHQLSDTLKKKEIVKKEKKRRSKRKKRGNK